MILTKNLLVDASLTDTKTELSFVGELQLVENALTELFGLLHIDGLTMQREHHCNLVYTRTILKNYKKVPWQEHITLSAFISSVTAIRFTVEFLFQDSQGDMIAHAKVEGVGIDMENQSLRRLNSIGIDKSLVEQSDGKDLAFARYDYDSLEEIESVRVRSSNIDYIHHTNNIEYVKFILNNYSVNYQDHHELKEAQIDYLNQSHENDVLTICGIKNEGEDHFLIRKEAQPIISARLLWK